MNESSHLFSGTLSDMKRQGGTVVKHKYVCPVCRLCYKIKLHAAFGIKTGAP